MRLGAWLVAFICVMTLALWAAAALGASISLCNLCANYTVSKRGNDVLIRCPGRIDPVFVLTKCANPSVLRSGGQVTITCR